MLVKALEVCFSGGSRRRVGAIFEYEGEGPLPKYLEPANPGPEDEIHPTVLGAQVPGQAPRAGDSPVPNPTEPETLSALGRQSEEDLGFLG